MMYIEQIFFDGNNKYAITVANTNVNIQVIIGSICVLYFDFKNEPFMLLAV